MRGLAVVVLGAVLIWFGLSRHDGGAVDASGGAASAVVDGSAEGDDSRGVRDLEFQRPVPVESSGYGPSGGHGETDRGDTDRGVDGSALALLEEDVPGGSVREGAGPDGYPPVSTGDDSRLEEPATGPGQGEPADHGANLRADSPPVGFSHRPEPPIDDGGFRFTHDASDDPARLAVLLLDAWITQDAADLLAFLQDGDGSDLPMAQRQLCAAFWEALVGKTEAARSRVDAIQGGEGVTTSQLGLLEAALDPQGQRAVPRSASSGRQEPLALAMRMMLLEDEAQSLLRARQYARSAVAWSDLIQYEVNAPWDPHRAALLTWGRELEKAQRNHRFSPKGAWPFIEEKVQNNDAMTKVRKRVIGRRPDLSICTGLIEAVNGITGYIHPGNVLRIPLDPVNVIVDLDARLLLYRHGDEVVRTWQVGIGKEQHETPIGEYVVGDKVPKPAHTTLGLPYGHPDNELGSRWLALHRDGKNTSYGIHGTSDPDGVGGEVSLGCIRMRNEEVNELFDILPKGSTVIIQP